MRKDRPPQISTSVDTITVQMVSIRCQETGQSKSEYLSKLIREDFMLAHPKEGADAAD